MDGRTRRLSRRTVLVRGGLAAGGVTALALGIPAAVASGDGSTNDFDAGVPTAWFDLATRLVRSTAGFTPPVASRAFAYAGLTLYEAVVAGSADYRSLQPVLKDLPPLPTADDGLHWPTAANAALATLFRLLFANTSDANRTAIDRLELSISAKSGLVATDATFAASARHGRAISERIFAWSKGDGGHEGQLRNFPPGYVPPIGPGLWKPTPPGFSAALQPAWGWNRCFAIASGAACPAPSPTPYSENTSSRFYSEAFEVYQAGNTLTVEQSAIAWFWSDDPAATATPPGHSVSIATQVLRAKRASLMTAAETYAKVGMAVADAFIACWYAKYQINLLRPITYLNANVDTRWLPLLSTPPFPEHPSGHSVQSGAAFQVLADLFGDRHPFDDHTHDERGFEPRRFKSFTQAANEAAISRLYGGIHYRPAIEDGLSQGRCIGRAVNALPFRN